MSTSPCTFKMGPITNCISPGKKYYILMGLNIWLAAIPVILVELLYLGLILNWNPLSWDLWVIDDYFQACLEFYQLLGIFGVIAWWFLLPFDFLFAFYFYAFLVIKIARFFLFIEKRVHPPKEGIIPRDFKDPDYFHWHVRRFIKRYPVWIVSLLPFPWMKRSYIYNQLGSKIGKNVRCLNAWIDLEFVQIEDNVLIGSASIISSYYFTPKFLIVKRVHVGKDCIIGSKSRVTPGTIIEQGVTLLAKSVTKMDDRLESCGIYGGIPAEKVELSSANL
ncbi:MAG: acyltransferase [Promethearchaeota archaeon]